MSADGPRKVQPRRPAPGEALQPLASPRVPLSGGLRTIPGPLLAPQVARLQDELSMVRKALRAQRAESRLEKQKNERLSEELHALRRATVSLEEQIPQAEENEESLESQRRLDIESLRQEYEARVSGLEAKCARDLAHMEEKYTAKLTALRNSLSAAEELNLAKNERIRRLEARLSRLHAEGAENQAVTPLSEDWEDLTVLRGVGPVYALALRRHGVLSLGQIADWTPEDVAAIAPQIGTTEARIFREGWVEQARKFRR